MKSNDVGKDPQRDALLTRRIALMAASGKPDKEIAKVLGVSTGVLDVLKKSPLFEQLVMAYADELEERGLDDVVQELLSDAPKNLSFIKRVRDGHFYDKKDRMDARLRAAKMLLDKQAPTADARQANQQAAKLIIDGKLLGQALRALRNVGVIDITPEQIESATGEDLPKIAARTPEDFEAAYTVPDPEDEL